MTRVAFRAALSYGRTSEKKFRSEPLQRTLLLGSAGTSSRRSLIRVKTTVAKALGVIVN